MVKSEAWEHVRDWSLVRPFVYYQKENFLPEGLVESKDVIDFSAGLGDLSAYVWSLGPKSLTATAPETDASRPPGLSVGVGWRTGVGADRIDRELPPESADVFLARMVIQFPTMEADAVDVDRILDQIHRVLRPGGSVVVTTHAFFSLPSFGEVHDIAGEHLEAVEADVTSLLDSENDLVRGFASETAGLIELVRYLGLPPREGPFGGTGFGLKSPMLVNSFVTQGFSVSRVEVIEPFTYPIGLRDRLIGERAVLEHLGVRVMAIKQRYLSSAAAGDPYARPAVLAEMLAEIRELVQVTAVPIVRVVASKLSG